MSISAPLLRVVATVEAAHHAGIDQDQQHEDIDGALLGNPKSQGKAADGKLIQPVRPPDAQRKGDNKPNWKEDSEQAKVDAPIASGAFRRGVVRHHGFYRWRRRVGLTRIFPFFFAKKDGGERGGRFFEGW